MKVYLAGKISQNDWRRSLGGERPFSMEAGEVADDENERNSHTDEFKNFFYELPVICKHPYIEVAGPFFLSCDHGCYHGHGTHGVGAVESQEDFAHYLGCSGPTFTQEEVAQICLSQIDRSDMVFAYINDETCFGTLFEIGYAAKAGKPVAVMFHSQALRRKMWFIGECADVVLIGDGSAAAKRPIVYLDEAVWIANRIAKEIYGSSLFYTTGENRTKEEGLFYAEFCHMTPKEQYQEYLKTDWWQRIRVERLKIDGYKCVCCGTEKNLQVHHTDYSKGWFHEDPRQDLITLCKKCHETKVHGN